MLNLINNPWLLAQRGVDIIGPLSAARAKTKYAIITNNYFTKWVEVEPLATVIEMKTSNFIWRAIIYRFSIPHVIVTDNG